MNSGIGSLQIARSGMTVSEEALKTTSHNIANLQTKGYSRQQVMFETGMYGHIGNGFEVGTGARVQETRQVRNAFVDNLYRIENSSLGYWSARQQVLEDVEAIIGEPMWDGIQNATSQFWDSWQELAKDPSGLAPRTLVRQRSEELVTALNRIGDEFYDLQEVLDGQIKSKVDEINGITKELASLNVKILENEIAGDRANDYRDQRNVLLDKLSGLVDVTSNEATDGQMEVLISGKVIVSKGKSYNLLCKNTGDTGTFNSVFVEYANEPLKVAGGQLYGMISARGEVYGSQVGAENGAPNTKVDITFAVDVADGEADYLNKIKESITSYVGDLKRRGLDYNLRLITYHSSNQMTDTNFYGDEAGFIDAVRSMEASELDFTNPYESIADAICQDGNFRENALRYACVFSDEKFGGNETAEGLALATKKLLDNHIVTLAAVPSENAANTEVGGWGDVAKATGGATFDISNENFTDLYKEMSNYVNGDVNRKIFEVPNTKDILPFVLKKMNAFANVLAREINYVHSLGNVFVNGEVVQAEDFFVKVNQGNPLMLGNMMVNPKFSNANYISSSDSNAVGDNSIANAISKLRDYNMYPNQKGNISTDEYYQVFIMELGTIGAEIKSNFDNQQKIVNVCDNNRQEIMNVSLDEEMADLLKYKFAYNASSKTFNLIDEMLDNIINKMGLIGR